MSQPDVILLHPPSVYDFRRKTMLYGPISDVIPSSPIFEMYPIGFTSIAVEILHRIDRIIANGGSLNRDERLVHLKRTLAGLNTATMCHQKELELPTPFIKVKVIGALWSLLMKR